MRSAVQRREQPVKKWVRRWGWWGKRERVWEGRMRVVRGGEAGCWVGSGLVMMVDV